MLSETPTVPHLFVLSPDSIKTLVRDAVPEPVGRTLTL